MRNVVIWTLLALTGGVGVGVGSMGAAQNEGETVTPTRAKR